MTAHVVLSMGSNIGDRRSYLVKAVQDVAQIPQISILQTSAVYETKPVGNTDQRNFYNIVVTLQTDLEPHVLLREIQAIEKAHGRTRNPHDQNAPRTLDIDIVDYAGLHVEDADLVLPHPRAHQRAFVLVPWLEIEPEAKLDDVRIADCVKSLELCDVVLRYESLI